MASSTESGYVDDWQRGKSIIECNLHMLTTEECSDVIFKVGSERKQIRAHRYILVSRSCVFNAMFCGPLAEKGGVTIPDIEADVFEEFLKFLYSGSADVTSDNVVGLLYTSRKYAVETLYNDCASFLEKSLKEEMVCGIIEECHLYGEEELEKKALQILTRAGKKVTESQGFQNLNTEHFKMFLESEELGLSEEEVFESALKWAKEQCRAQRIVESPQNLRKTLGDMIYDIRFSNMPMEYLITTVGPSQLLTSDERIAIIDRTLRTDLDISPFKTGGRKSKEVKVVSRFETILGGWKYSHGFKDVIDFSVDHDINLLGFQLFGPLEEKDQEYMLSIEVMHKDTVLAKSVQESVTLKGGSAVTDIFLPSSVEIRRCETYSVSVLISGVGTYSGKNGLASVTVDGITFSFMNSDKSLNGTSVSEGQIPGLIWRPK